MNKIFITSAVVSKGYQDKPALRFSDKSEGTSSVRFKVDERLYDKRADNNTRYINHSVKAFGNLADRIEKMGVKEGSYLNLSGRLDEDVWEDGGVTKRAPVIILEDIEFSYSGTNGKKNNVDAPDPGGIPEDHGYGEPAQSGGNFGGFSPFGGENMLY
ncbi:MAG TPA: hypothetical protein DEQ02_05425 [Ruminococcaceae bacterium]|nr:hypothetical protein [Oscillospiraceae bacterium]